MSFNGRPASIAWALLCLLVAQDSSAADSAVSPYIAAIDSKAQEAEKSKLIVVRGTDPWLFFAPELRALTVGPFWGADASRISRATNPQFADPLGPIIDFNEQLKLEGIELLVVPVPPKAAIYPEGLAPGIKAGADATRVDATHAQFYKLLSQRGVNVVDLHDDFMKQKAASGNPLYCRKDSHWSGRGVQVAAASVADRVKSRPWYQDLHPERKFVKGALSVELVKVQFAGDLELLLNEQKTGINKQEPGPETLTLSKVTLKSGGQEALIPTDAESPVLLLGDSHTLVFHDPMLYAEGCGLVDHLALKLELRVDLIGVRGSGANAARVSWRRRPDPLKGKKLVIWCFSFREFTENTDGWKKIAVKRPQ